MPILTEEERLGTLIAGRYRLHEILGRGGTGVVFEASHTWTGRRVAVKLLKPEYARDVSLVRRFLQEARTAAGLDHPHVVQVLDMGNDRDGTVYLVLELLEGESLSRKLERDKVLTSQTALNLLVPVMEALTLAHEQGIIHRDLKPDNVFLKRGPNGMHVPKLLDFGMAKMIDAAWGSATQSGTLVGTPFYMSPEQAEGKKDQGPASDVWSMGVILYRCLSGDLPFFASTPTALLLAIVQNTPKPLRELAPSVPEPISAVVDRAITADREVRYADVRAMLKALKHAAGEAGLKWPEPMRHERPSERPFDPGPPSNGPEITQKIVIGEDIEDDAPPPPQRRWIGVASIGAALVIAVGLVAGALALRKSRAGEAEMAGAPNAAVANAPADEAPARLPAVAEPPSREPTATTNRQVGEASAASTGGPTAVDVPTAGTGEARQAQSASDDAQTPPQAAPVTQRRRTRAERARLRPSGTMGRTAMRGATSDDGDEATDPSNDGARIPGVTREW